MSNPLIRAYDWLSAEAEHSELALLVFIFLAVALFPVFLLVFFTYTIVGAFVYPFLSGSWKQKFDEFHDSF